MGYVWEESQRGQTMAEWPRKGRWTLRTTKSRQASVGITSEENRLQAIEKGGNLEGHFNGIKKGR